MSIVSANEIHRGRGGEESDDFSATATRTWRVETDDPLDDEETLWASGLFPAIFDSHPRNSFKLCRRRTADQDDGSARFWTVTAEYSTKPISGIGDGGVQEYDNPLGKPPEVSWEEVNDKKDVAKNRQGTALLNKAGDPVSQEKRIKNAKLKIAVNRESFDGSEALQYMGKINSSSFYGGAAGTLMFSIPSAQFKNDKISTGTFFAYVTITYEFEYDRDGWQPVRLEQGYQQYVYKGGSLGTHPDNPPPSGVTPTKERIKDDNEEDVTEMVPLDQYGRKIYPEYLPDACIFTTDLIYDEFDFNSLNIF